jgi:tRNA G18 (ribose-2'-O)-methylase SpoU
MSARGYFGIGIQGGKSPENLGGLWRSAHAFGAAFIFTIGCRYSERRQPADVSDSQRHIPLFQYPDIESFLAVRPVRSELVAVECGQGDPIPLPCLQHPERAIYVLGAEDHGIHPFLLDACDRQVSIPGSICLNVATAGSIVLYDRVASRERAA